MHRSWWLVLVMLCCASACARRTAELSVVRPALINAAPFGNQYEVRAFDGDPVAAAFIGRALRARIVQSLNRSIVLVEQGGGLAISGEIGRLEYSEREERERATCYRTEGSGSSQQTVSYACTRPVRVGTLAALVEFRVAVASSGQVLFARAYEASRSARVEGAPGAITVSPEAVTLDARAMRDDALEELVERFSRVILPWRQTVEVTFEPCDGDARCDQGYQAVQAQRLDVADALFTRVLEADRGAVAHEQRTRVADAYYNRAMVRLIQGQFGPAFMDLQRALQLDPQRELFRQRFQLLENLARDQEALRQQVGARPPSSGSEEK
jgi:tetratricopeptide (TPR) repeat protein